MGYENRAGEKAALVVVTDLLDPVKYPAEEMADLYMERWQIKVKFRDLKTTMKMENFEVETPEMAHKTLKMMVIAYNLLRTTMQETAHEAGKKVNEMSVEGTRCVLTSPHETFRVVAGKPRLEEQLYRSMLTNCAEHVLDIRPSAENPGQRNEGQKTTNSSRPIDMFFEKYSTAHQPTGRNQRKPLKFVPFGPDDDALRVY